MDRACGWVAMLVTALLLPATSNAEFYTWTDTSGQPRVSNIPPRAVRIDGSVDARFSPFSMVAQQAALRARFKARDAQLSAARAAHQSSAAVDSTGAK